MSILRYSHPLASAPWSGLENDIDTLLTVFAGRGACASGGARSLAVDVAEDQDRTYLRADLPGVKREDIKVEVADGRLTISATRQRQPNGGEAETVAFSRSFELPAGVAADKATASYENGVLTVALPKPEAVKPRQIAVN